MPEIIQIGLQVKNVNC